MARFQALTNAVLDTEVDLLRKRFGLEPNQKADLLHEMALIAGCVARQAEHGRVIEARRGEVVERLMHPALERLRGASGQPLAQQLTLSDAEAQRLAALLERGFAPPPALCAALANLARSLHLPPPLDWPPTA